MSSFVWSENALFFDPLPSFGVLKMSEKGGTHLAIQTSQP